MSSYIYLSGSNWPAEVYGPFIVISKIYKGSLSTLIEIKLLDPQYKNFISCHPKVTKKSHACIRNSTLKKAIKITNIMDLIKYRLCK